MPATFLTVALLTGSKSGFFGFFAFWNPFLDNERRCERVGNGCPQLFSQLPQTGGKSGFFAFWGPLSAGGQNIATRIEILIS